MFSRDSPDLSLEALILQQNTHQYKITDINFEIKGKSESETKQISIDLLMTTIEEQHIQLLLKKLKMSLLCLININSTFFDDFIVWKTLIKQKTY